MLRFDDLLAARFVHRQRPELRRALAVGLRGLDDPACEPHRTLLGDLVKREVVTREQGAFIHQQVERARRGRAVSIYARLLVDRGVPETTVQALLPEVGEAGDLMRLGGLTLARSLLPPDVEGKLRFQAKLACDHEATRQVEEYRSRELAESAQTCVGETPQPPAGRAESTGARPRGSETPQPPAGRAGSMASTTPGSQTGDDLASTLPGSGVFRVDGVQVASGAEVTAILDRAALGLGSSQVLEPPRFPVPDWIDTAHPMAGQQVGAYRILGKVGAGAMATVYLADTGERERPVALKLVPPQESRERQARFKREILANGFVQHDNIVDVYDAGVASSGHHYLAMEFFESEDLEQVLLREGSFSLRQAVKVGRQVAHALAAAHGAGIVHRDVKPSNILISQDGNTAKLSDFGLALIGDLGDFKDKVFESDAGGVTGTPEYVSPEQAMRDPVGPPSDLYSLGLVLYRMLTARLPFAARSANGWIQAHMHQPPLPLQQAVPGGSWPVPLLELLDRLFVKDPRQRIQTAGEVIERLERVFEGLGATRRRIGPFRRGF